MGETRVQKNLGLPFYLLAGALTMKTRSKTASRNATRKLSATLLVVWVIIFGIVDAPITVVFAVGRLMAVVNTVLLIGLLVWVESRRTPLLRRQTLSRWSLPIIVSGLGCAFAVLAQLGVIK
jgi:hypothetical protein